MAIGVLAIAETGANRLRVHAERNKVRRNDGESFVATDANPVFQVRETQDLRTESAVLCETFAVEEARARRPQEIAEAVREYRLAEVPRCYVGSREHRAQSGQRLVEGPGLVVHSWLESVVVPGECEATAIAGCIEKRGEAVRRHHVVLKNKLNPLSTRMLKTAIGVPCARPSPF